MPALLIVPSHKSKQDCLTCNSPYQAGDLLLRLWHYVKTCSLACWLHETTWRIPSNQQIINNTTNPFHFLTHLSSKGKNSLFTHERSCFPHAAHYKLSSSKSHWDLLGNYTRGVIHLKVFMTGHFKWPLASLLLIRVLHPLIPLFFPGLDDEFVIVLLPFYTLSVSRPHKMCISERNVHYVGGSVEEIFENYMQTSVFLHRSWYL